MQITIDRQTAEALTFIWRGYYFGMFKPIRRNIEEEYRLRDALKNLIEAIEEAKADEHTNHTKETTQ